MTDYRELKRLAEAATPGPWAYDGSYVCPARTEDGTTYVELWRSIADCHQPENTKFIAAANPAAALALIAEVDSMKVERDYCRRVADHNLDLGVAYMTERDQLKAEVEALRKDAERYRWLREKVGVDFIFGEFSPWLPGVEADMDDLDKKTTDKSIDAAMGKGDS